MSRNKKIKSDLQEMHISAYVFPPYKIIFQKICLSKMAAKEMAASLKVKYILQRMFGLWYLSEKKMNLGKIVLI